MNSSDVQQACAPAKSKSTAKKSTSSSKKTSSRQAQPSQVASTVNIRHQESENISASELREMANKEKIRPVSESVVLQKHNSTRESNSSSASSGGVRAPKVDSKRRAHQVKKENKNSEIRAQKMKLLGKLSHMCSLHSRKFTSDILYTLDEIEQEYETISSELKNKSLVKKGRQGLLLAVRALEWATTTYNPEGHYVDLGGWTEGVGYSLESNDENYDEVILELMQKYTSDIGVGPELKLLGMLTISAVTYSTLKKQNVVSARQGNAQPTEESIMSSSAGLDDGGDDINDILEQMKAAQREKEAAAAAVAAMPPAPVKRKPGRPRKHPLPA